MRDKKLIFFIFFIYIFISFFQEVRCEVKNIKAGGPIKEIRATPLHKKIRDLREKIDISKTKPMDNIIEEILPDKKLTIDALKNLVEIKDFPLNRRVVAARLLGELRVAEAIDILLDNLLLGHKRTHPVKELDANVFPVGFALINIGIPAREKLLRKIQTTNDEQLIPLCAYVISKIEGTDVAKFIFTKAMEQEQHSKTKAKLQKALDFLE